MNNEWIVLGKKDASLIHKAAHVVCYHGHTESLLLLFCYIDEQTGEQNWVWNLIPGPNTKKRERKKRRNEPFPPPLKWADEYLNDD